MKLAQFIICVSMISATTVLQFYYSKSDRCNGPPDKMYAFEVEDLNYYLPGENETWPLFFELQMYEYGYYEICGSAPIWTDECCYSSVDLSSNGSNGYLSAKTRLATQNDIDGYLEGFPVDSNGFSYCNITTHSENIENYKFRMYLSNSQCIDEQFMCQGDGTLELFDGVTGCNGQSNLLNPNTSNYLSSGIINYSNFIQISGGMALTQWVAYIPSKYVVPNTWSLPDIISRILFITLCMSMVWFCGHNIKGALKLKSKSSLTKLQLITQLILTLQSILYTYYANSTLGTVNEQMIIVGICDAVMIFATLLMVSQTNVVLITIKKLNIYIQIGLFFITITLHVGLSGSMYLSYCWQSYIDWCPSFDFLNLWYNLVPYWILITFTWNTLPSLVILITLMFALDKNTNILKTIHKLYSLDKYYIYLIGLQIVITASFFSSGILYGYTNILGDDKWSVLMLLFQRVLLTMHSIINHLTLNRVIGIIQNLQKCDSFFTSKVESHLRN